MDQNIVFVVNGIRRIWRGLQLEILSHKSVLLIPQSSYCVISHLPGRCRSLVRHTANVSLHLAFAPRWFPIPIHLGVTSAICLNCLKLTATRLESVCMHDIIVYFIFINLCTRILYTSLRRICACGYAGFGLYSILIALKVSVAVDSGGNLEPLSPEFCFIK